MKKLFTMLLLCIPISASALDYAALWSLISEHPNWTGPGSVTVEALDAYADTTENILPDYIASAEVWKSIINNQNDYIGLTDIERELIRTTVKGGGVQQIDIRSDIDGAGTDAPERKLLINIFGAGSATINELVAKFTETLALWQQYGVGQNPDPEDFIEAIDRYGS